MKPVIPAGPRLGKNPSRFRLYAVPVVTVMLGSTLTALPIIAQSPILPPFALLILLSWRLLRPDLWQAWIALPLGLFDDLMSGQPLGSGVFLWTVTLMAIDLTEHRFLWRDYWQDWLIAAGAVIFCLTGGWLFALMTGGGGSIAIIMPQMIWSILLYPFVARQVMWVDRWRIMA